MGDSAPEVQLSQLTHLWAAALLLCRPHIDRDGRQRLGKRHALLRLCPRCLRSLEATGSSCLRCLGPLQLCSRSAKTLGSGGELCVRPLQAGVCGADGQPALAVSLLEVRECCELSLVLRRDAEGRGEGRAWGGDASAGCRAACSRLCGD